MPINPLKPVHRFLGDVRLIGNANQYVVRSRINKNRSDNIKHFHRAGRCLGKFTKATTKAERNREVAPEFSTLLPAKYDGYADEVKFGYYMDPCLINEAVTVCSPLCTDLAADRGREFSPEDIARESLSHFRRLLRGEDFNVQLAIFGANIILQLDKKRKKSGEARLDGGLFHLAGRLYLAHEHIGIKTDSFSGIKSAGEGFVDGAAFHDDGLETGDVLVKKIRKEEKSDKSKPEATFGAKSESKSFHDDGIEAGDQPVKAIRKEKKLVESTPEVTFRTKPIGSTRTRYRSDTKKLRKPEKTVGKLSAAYQSLYSIVAYEKKKRSDGKPFVVTAAPLLGHDNDGFPLNQEGDMISPATLKAAIRAVTITPELYIRLECNDEGHAGLRRGLREELKKIAPGRKKRGRQNIKRAQRQIKSEGADRSAKSVLKKVPLASQSANEVEDHPAVRRSIAPTSNADKGAHIDSTGNNSVSSSDAWRKADADLSSRDHVIVEDDGFNRQRLVGANVSHNSSWDKTSLPRFSNSEESSSDPQGSVVNSSRTRSMSKAIMRSVTEKPDVRSARESKEVISGNPENLLSGSRSELSESNADADGLSVHATNGGKNQSDREALDELLQSLRPRVSTATHRTRRPIIASDMYVRTKEEPFSPDIIGSSKKVRIANAGGEISRQNDGAPASAGGKRRKMLKDYSKGVLIDVVNKRRELKKRKK